MEALSLFELNNLVRETLENTFCEAYWVKAEISSAGTSGGHCYLELVEKEPDGYRIAAKAKATIWRSTYALLRPHFERITGQPFCTGMKILVQVEVVFHEQYGFSLNVVDIDPTYTLGDIAQRRQEILQRLEKEGVAEMNKELHLPRLLQRIAVISSDTAAGYGDFCNQIEQSGLRFHLQLFPAILQGDRVESSVMAALDKINAESHLWDAVVIIRGGGAVSDLNGFDTYDLANYVAQFPLPVLTGIGHERDNTVLDYVANMRLKTPTAVAAFLIDRMQAEVDRVNEAEETLRQTVADLLEEERRNVEQLIYRLRISFSHFSARQNEQLNNQLQTLQQTILRRFASADANLEMLEKRLPELVRTRLDREQQRLEMYRRNLEMAGPERILSLGFSITTCNGQIITQARQLKPGDRVVSQLKEGSIKSIVE